MIRTSKTGQKCIIYKNAYVVLNITVNAMHAIDASLNETKDLVFLKIQLYLRWTTVNFISFHIFIQLQSIRY